MADLTSRVAVVISASTGGAVRELDTLQRQASKTDTAFDTLGKKAGLAGATIKAGLVAGAGALLGTGLVSFLNDSATAFADSAKAAGDLAAASGGTVEGVSALQAALADAGVSSETSAGLLTKFTTQAGKSKGTLKELGVVLKRGKDGSIDYADGMVRAVDAIMRIGDASTRNQKFVELFGKQGAKAFQDLAAAGVPLSEAMEAISKYRVFDADDVARAAAYDDAMDNLGASVQGLQFALGRDLVPALGAAADGASSMLGFMSAIPNETYLAVGGFAALKGAASFLGPSFSAGLTAGATALTGLGAAADGAGGKAAALKSGFGGLVRAVGPWNLAFVGLAAAITAISVGADNAQGRLEEFAAGLDGSKGSLQSSAAAMLETSSAWERFWITLTNNSEGFGPGTATRIFNEALVAAFDGGLEKADAYEAALRRTKEEMGAAAAAAADFEFRQRDLNDTVTDFLNSEPGTTWQDVADAARDAADAQGLVKEATRLAAEQLAIAAGDVGYFLDELAKLENVGGSSVEALKADLEGITFTDVADTWANEATIGAERAYDTILGGLKTALEVNPDLDLSAWLEQFRGLSPQLDAVIDQLLADVSTDTKIQAALGITPDPSVAETQAAVDALGNPITGTFDLTTGEGVAAAEAQREELGKPIDTTLTVDTEFEPGGYEAVKSRVDFLAREHAGLVTLDTGFEPGGYNAVKSRVDFLAKTHKGLVDIDVAFAPGGYNAVKARVDYLAQNRTATITINQVTRRSTVNVGGGEDGEAFGLQRRIPNLYANVSPTNIFKVSIDGQPLRAWIRSEVAAAQPVTAGVA